MQDKTFKTTSDKKDIFSFYRIGLYTHMTTAPIVVFCGAFQFLFQNSKWHKVIGRIYVFLILIFAAPSGLLMSFYAIGGWLSILNFSVLSILWFIYTYRAYQAARRRQFQLHKELMISSFILTNSAILLRIFSAVNHFAGDLLSYTWIAILSWLPVFLIWEYRRISNARY